MGWRAGDVDGQGDGLVCLMEEEDNGIKYETERGEE